MHGPVLHMLMLKSDEASHIRQIHLSGIGSVPFMTDNWGSTVPQFAALTCIA